MPHGYLIKNGLIYDGSGSPAKAADVRVRGRLIHDIGPSLRPEGEEVVEAQGLIVTPGLIDLHAHLFPGVGVFSVDPADAGLRTGVTTLLDTGTAGALTFEAFHRYVMPVAKEEIYALLNISMIGCVHRHDREPFLSDLFDARLCSVSTAVACIEKYRDRIIGTKVRLTAGIADNKVENERAGLKGAVEAARRTGLPCMVHHAMSNIPLADVVDTLRHGDIYTHLYNPYNDRGFAADTGAPLDALRRARERGIILDVGHGVGAFDWLVAEAACQQHDFWPDTISTDIHAFNLHGPVFDMTTTLSKFLHLGMPMEKVIRAATHDPARAMRMSDRLGLLAKDRIADITLLRLRRGTFRLVDSNGNERQATRRLAPVQVFKRGERYHCPET